MTRIDASTADRLEDKQANKNTKHDKLRTRIIGLATMASYLYIQRGMATPYMVARAMDGQVSVTKANKQALTEIMVQQIMSMSEPEYQRILGNNNRFMAQRIVKWWDKYLSKRPLSPTVTRALADVITKEEAQSGPDYELEPEPEPDATQPGIVRVTVVAPIVNALDVVIDVANTVLKLIEHSPEGYSSKKRAAEIKGAIALTTEFADHLRNMPGMVTSGPAPFDPSD